MLVDSDLPSQVRAKRSRGYVQRADQRGHGVFAVLEDDLAQPRDKCMSRSDHADAVEAAIRGRLARGPYRAAVYGDIRMAIVSDRHAVIFIREGNISQAAADP